MNTVGVIGCGGVVHLFYLNILKSHFATSEKLFFDIDFKRAEETAKLVSGKAVTLSTLIRQSDFIIITTPPHTHFDLLMQSIGKNKKVFCEKPFLLKKSEALTVINAAEEHQVKIFAGYLRRFYPAVNQARNFLACLAKNKIRRIEIFEGGRFNYESITDYLYKNPFGGVLPDTGSHSIDTMMFIAGLDTSEVSFKLKSKEATIEPSHEFKAAFEIIGSSTIDCSIYLSRWTNLSNKINFYLEEGILEVPLFTENSIRYRNLDGESFVMHSENWIHSIDDAFYRQFQHILHEKGKILEAFRIINTTAALECLLGEVSA